jgi:hypothetical protein
MLVRARARVIPDRGLSHNARMKWLVCAALVASTAAQADPLLQPRVRTPFDQGRFNLGFGAGSQTALGFRYFVVAGGAGYYVLDGVELGLGASHQFGDGPGITRATPGLRYVAQPLVGRSPLIPYVGVFYSHYFIGEGYRDVDTAGMRGGLLHVSGSLVIGLGVAFERVVSACASNCSTVYPDFTLSLAL